jgi:hypothetical protein
VSMTAIYGQFTCTIKLQPLTTGDLIQRVMEGELRENIPGRLFPSVVTGLVKEAKYQEGDVAVMYPANEKDIAKITQPRTTSTLCIY